MDGSPAGGWGDELERWLEPFLARLRREAQRRWAPVHLKGLLLPGERKNVEPMAARVAPGDTQRRATPSSCTLGSGAAKRLRFALGHGPSGGRAGAGRRPARGRAGRGAGGRRHRAREARPALGRREAAVPRQLGRRANCQSLVSLTLARAELPVCVGLRLFLPEDWCADAGRRTAAGVPAAVAYRPKWRIALDEIDRVLASGARFRCVLADAEYGKAAEFRRGLAERHLPWAVGVLPAQKVYPADVTLAPPARKATGRPPKHPVPSAASVGAAELFEGIRCVERQPVSG